MSEDGAESAGSARSARSAPSGVWWRTRLAEDSALVVVAVLVAVLVRAFAAQAYYIPSPSMVPQLRVNDRVVVSRLAYHLHGVHRGDIVVFRAPPGVAPAAHPPSNPFARVLRDAGVALGLTQDETVLIKRVLALPGEAVSGRGGHVYVNGELVVEPYLPKGVTTTSFAPVVVPKGFVWVMGDNRGNSEDSRFFGPIPERTIVGRAVWRVWPPWRPAFL